MSCNQIVLQDDLKQYYQCKGVFIGGHKDALTWWENLPTTANKNPLKALAITIHSIVPHAAEVERLFSALGGTQSTKRCNLSVSTFETLGKLRANYSRHLYNRDCAEGKPIHRRHAHMHTRTELGINVDLVNDLNESFTWTPPFSLQSDDDNNDLLADPEDVTLDDIDDAFNKLEDELRKEKEALMDQDVDGGEILEGQIYDFAELAKINAGEVPKPANEDIEVIGSDNEDDWDVETMVSGVYI